MFHERYIYSRTWTRLILIIMTGIFSLSQLWRYLKIHLHSVEDIGELCSWSGTTCDTGHVHWIPDRTSSIHLSLQLEMASILDGHSLWWSYEKKPQPGIYKLTWSLSRLTALTTAHMDSVKIVYTSCPFHVSFISKYLHMTST